MNTQEIVDLIPELSEAMTFYPAGKGIDDIYEKLIPIAKEHEHTWGEGFVDKVFFGGGRVPEYKKAEDMGCSEEDAVRALRWLKAAMGSFYPSHGDKVRVCGMLWELFFLEPAEEVS
jgi:hypothetical protein